MSRTPHCGWREEWLDGNTPIVDELFIKCFVNRYFALPEDWDEDDIPLVMIWRECIVCGCTDEYFIRETEEAWQGFIYNGGYSYTYTCLDNPECNHCSSPDSDNSRFQEERRKTIEKEYNSLLSHQVKMRKMQFESAIEDYFWKAWQITFPAIPLIPQYPVSNYRVDFVHIPTRTAIELDGRQFHSTPQQIAYDKERQAYIEKYGWRFLRFKGSDINCHIDSCIIQTLYFLSKAYPSLFDDQVEYRFFSLLGQVRKSYNNRGYLDPLV